jgi:hypothetical protein
MAKIIESFNLITSEWLEEVLNAPSGTVAFCTITHSWETPVTQVAVVHIDLKNTGLGLPTTIFIKIPKNEQHKELREMCGREVLFYSEIASTMKATYIPRCYYAAHDMESGAFNIILEDLSETHFQTDYPLPPTTECCEMAIDCLVKLHAAWWNRQGPEAVLGTYPQKEQILEWMKYTRSAWGRFSDFMGDRLSKSRKQLIERAIDNTESNLARSLGSKCLTLTHTDAHLWNFLFPKSSAGEVKLIDWQSYRYGFAVDDLIPMIALNWYPERRQRFESPMLRVRP